MFCISPNSMNVLWIIAVAPPMNPFILVFWPFLFRRWIASLARSSVSIFWDFNVLLIPGSDVMHEFCDVGIVLHLAYPWFTCILFSFWVFMYWCTFGSVCLKLCMMLFPIWQMLYGMSFGYLFWIWVVPGIPSFRFMLGAWKRVLFILQK